MRKKTIEASEVSTVLHDGVIKLIFSTAKVKYSSPVFLVRIAVNPAAVIFGFENEDPLLINGKAVDLDEVIVGGEMAKVFSVELV